MFDILIDEIDLLAPPFADDEMGDLCGGKIATTSLIDGQFSVKPVLSGSLSSNGVIDEEETLEIPMAGRITSKLLMAARVSVRPLLSGILKSIGLMDETKTLEIPLAGKITSRAVLGRQFSVKPVLSGLLSSISLIGCGKIEAHICGGEK